ncbi:MAG: MBL fold metallo-hydrolase [Gemmobacter sp.]
MAKTDPPAPASGADPESFSVRLWGTRGSLPVSGPDHRKYGGNTICFEMRLGTHVLLFDAGSGLVPAGAALAAEGRAEAMMFFTHWHYDHVMGLPFFAPFYNPAFRLKVWAGHTEGQISVEGMMEDFMRQPFFPVGPGCFRAAIQSQDFSMGDVITPCPGLVIRTARLHHPGNAVGYRVEWAGRVAAVVTDTEHHPGTMDDAVLGLMQGADLVLYDACYDDEEFDNFAGFGHSTWQQGVRLAEAAGVGQIALVHHSVRRSDADLDRIDRAARRRFAGASCARDMQVITL